VRDCREKPTVIPIAIGNERGLATESPTLKGHAQNIRIKISIFKEMIKVEILL
jgi:hypothetical protein